MVLVSGSENTRATRAGARASFANRSGSGDHGTMSMRSPFSSFTTACTREPFIPTHAPTGSIESSRDETAILVRLPASRAVGYDCIGFAGPRQYNHDIAALLLLQVARQGLADLVGKHLADAFSLPLA